MNRDLARKAPATIIDQRPIPKGDLVRLGGKDMREVQTKANYLYRQGRVLPEYTVRRVRDNRWEATVTLVPRPSWLRRNRMKLVFIPLGGMAALTAGYFLVQAVAVAIMAVIPYAIGACLIMAAGSLAAGPRIIEIVQRVTIRR